MERRLPKNVRQVGNVSDEPKIYLEDYVDTYLDQLKCGTTAGWTCAFLTGSIQESEEEACVYITGAIQLKKLQGENIETVITGEEYQNIQEQCKRFFPEDKIIGWFIYQKDYPLDANETIRKLHERFFPKKYSILVLASEADGEEDYYAFKYQELMKIGGHYIFYEKNPAMQNYMIYTRKRNGVTPSEVVEDKAAENFRSTMREKLGNRNGKKQAGISYSVSMLMVVLVLAIGISTMNNYEKMKAVQSSVESLMNSAESEEKGETVAEMQVEIPEEQQQQPQEQQEEQSQESQEESAETVPTTIQEELEPEAYYVVQRGDTLDRISWKIYGTTTEVDAICKMNGLTDGNLIYIGQRLLLP